MPKTSEFDHAVTPLDDGTHPKYRHLTLFEIESECGSYILTAHGNNGDCLISSDDAEHMFGSQFNEGYAYLTDEYLQLLA